MILKGEKRQHEHNCGAVCLTGDVHHKSGCFIDQAYLSGSEVDAALSYVDIATDLGVKTTLFFTGKCVKQETESLRRISRNPLVEMGGHNYNAFLPKVPYKLSKRILGLSNGPKCLQRLDIERTYNCFKRRLGTQIVSWRDHAYRHDRNTRLLLEETGISYFSDICSPKFTRPFMNGALWNVPINILPDHDFIYHGKRMPGKFNEAALFRSNFKTGAMWISEWFEKIKEQIKLILKDGGLATVLVHPACMEVCDGFKTFKRLCRFLAQHESLCMKDIGDNYV